MRVAQLTLGVVEEPAETLRELLVVRTPPAPPPSPPTSKPTASSATPSKSPPTNPRDDEALRPGLGGAHARRDPTDFRSRLRTGSSSRPRSGSARPSHPPGLPHPVNRSQDLGAPGHRDPGSRRPGLLRSTALATRDTRRARDCSPGSAPPRPPRPSTPPFWPSKERYRELV